MEKIKLYQFPSIERFESSSPFCVKVGWALHYKRLLYDSITLSDSAAVAAVNPRAKLPALSYGEATIADSSDIIRFIESRHPEPRLYPSDPALHARAIILEDWGDESLFWHLLYERWQIDEQFDHYAAGLFAGAPDQVVREIRERELRDLRCQGFGRMTIDEQRAKLCESLDALDAILDADFLCGNELSVADLGVAAQVAGLDISITPVAAAEVRKRHRVSRWLDRVTNAVA
jgi:glutathione S-transferase